jgi:hypothetical protein
MSAILMQGHAAHRSSASLLKTPDYLEAGDLFERLTIASNLDIAGDPNLKSILMCANRRSVVLLRQPHTNATLSSAVINHTLDDNDSRPIIAVSL